MAKILLWDLWPCNSAVFEMTCIWYWMTGEWITYINLLLYEIFNRHSFIKQRFATEPRLVVAMLLWRKKNALACVACEFVELREIVVLMAKECVKQWLPSEWVCADMWPAICVEMRGATACIKMRVVSIPPNHGSSAWDTSGKCTGSEAQVCETAVPCIGGSGINKEPAR